MFSRVLSLALCLVCAPCFAAVITSEVTIGHDDPIQSYSVRETGHLTVQDGAVVRELSVNGGRADILGGTFTDLVWLDDRGTVVNISGGTFEEFSVVNDDNLTLNISGGDFTRGVQFNDSGWGGGTVTITGGNVGGVGFGGVGKITWTAHIHGGNVTSAAGSAGNVIHVYGHRLNYFASEYIDHLGRPRLAHNVNGVLEDGTGISWFIPSTTWIVPGGPMENVYVLHELGSHIPGDTNGDGFVDIADLNNVRNVFGLNDTKGDADSDGDTDIDDLNLVRNRFGSGVVSSQAVPEPSTELLLFVATLVGSMCRLRW